MATPAKVALVTASSAGLGAAIVHALAPHYRVVVNYFSRPEKAESVIASASKLQPHFQSTEPRFHAIKADASNRSEIQAMVAETVEKMGRLDVVVSNNGWTRLTDFFDLDDQVREEDWDRCFNANVKSHLWLLYAAKPYLEKSDGVDEATGKGIGGGAFVTVASLAGVRPSGSSLPYSVTKAAEIHLTKGLALICGKNVRCNSISPGLMMTEWGERFPKAKVEATMARAALKSTADPADVADQVRSLVMSRSITGQNVVVDCGIAV